MHFKIESAPDTRGHDETRRQLLEAAGDVFATTGFRQATVREICRRAGANVAAVNYHFGDKEALYAEVLRHAHRKAFEKYPLLPESGASASPADKLRAFVRSFLLRIFDHGPTAWFGKMMAWEMIEPTGALDSLLEERMRPMANQLGGIVAEILGGSPDDERTRLCCLSVVSQCVFYHHCRQVVARLFPAQQLNAGAIEPLANHITSFSLAAMRHLPEVGTAKRRPRRSSPGRH